MLYEGFDAGLILVSAIGFQTNLALLFLQFP